ncbi:hypothetical protein BT96DRAFT_560307 [Gymnopus androsaceus JB14]|uniref:UBA domain-containing protein n=1 Tax=Gymnopus androsaceus JB14 TaxID=1447944 RepID=A0A6A4HZH5_9AGAR|nr:hypothetical protein BT96DRAFT_560307 [Gymnopus androsaceus JB14]
MTIAERAALVEKERVNSLLQQRQTLQKQASTPSAWDGLDSLGSKTFATSAPKEEDDWGLGDFAAPAAPAAASNALLDMDEFSALDDAGRASPGKDFDFGTREDTDDDILGDLSRPVESIQREKQQKTTTPPSRTQSPPPHVLGQLIEMGFSITQARTALASTDSGQDVQAALEILIANGATSAQGPSEEGWDSDDEERGFTGGRSQRRRSPSPVQEPQPRPRRDRQIAQQKQLERERNAPSPSSQQGGLQADKILAQASEIGFTLFNRANAVWKEGREKVQKVYEERMAAGSEDGKGSGRSTPTNTKPKWMQEGFGDVEEVPGPSRKPKAMKPAQPTEELDLFSDATANLPSTTGVYVSKFRHAKPKAPVPPPRSLSPAPPPPPHPITTVSASSSAIFSSQQSKSSGTSFFKLGDFPAAETAYTRAIDALPAGHALLIPLYNNRALVRLKVGDVNGVVGDTGQVEELIGGVGSLREELKRGNGGKISVAGQEEVNLGDALVKAWKRRAEAMEGREKWEEAGKHWEKVAGAEWAGQSVRGEGARGAGRCRKMHQQGTEPPKSKRKPKPKPVAAAPLVELLRLLHKRWILFAPPTKLQNRRIYSGMH